MKTLYGAVAAVIAGLLTSAFAQTQTVYRQCFVETPTAFYWSAIASHPSGEYETRLFQETFGIGFERSMSQQLSRNVDVHCSYQESFSSLNSDRERWMYNYRAKSHTMTGWTDGRPAVSGAVNAPRPERGRPPAIVVSTPDNRRTPGEIAREEAQRAADRQRAADQAQRTATLQAEAERVRQRAAAAAAAADARDRANRCGQYRDPNSPGACVSPQ